MFGPQSETHITKYAMMTQSKELNGDLKPKWTKLNMEMTRKGNIQEIQPFHDTK